MTVLVPWSSWIFTPTVNILLGFLLSPSDFYIYLLFWRGSGGSGTAKRLLEHPNLIVMQKLGRELLNQDPTVGISKTYTKTVGDLFHPTLQL